MALMTFLAVGLNGDKVAMRWLARQLDGVVVEGPRIQHESEIIAALPKLPMKERSAAIRDTIFTPQLHAVMGDVARAMARPDAVLVTSIGLEWGGRASRCVRFEVSGNRPEWTVCLPVPGGVGFVGPRRPKSDRSGRWLAGFGSMTPACGDVLDEALAAGCDPVTDFDRQMLRASGLIHHGGYGSVVAAVRAGIPQIIVPVLGCQQDMGRLVERIGVGVWLRHGESLAEAMAMPQPCRDRPHDDSAGERQAIRDDGDNDFAKNDKIK